MSITPISLRQIGSSIKCSHHVPLKTILLPLCFLGILGFLINTQMTFLSGENLRSCQPRKNIVFLKTHKCAGSSIQNIIMRYGDGHNLTFVLPPEGNYLGHPAPFSSSLLPAVPAIPVYNILAHHTRLDRDEMTALMPRDTVFVTIVRDPARVFESSYVYYDLNKFFGGSLHKFVRFVPRLNRRFLSRRFHGKFGINQMMFDLGADPDIFHNDTLVKRYVKQLDSWFDLVLVAERMDESLILLKHLMCWDIDDVAVFKVNARNPKFKSKLSEKDISILRALNQADQVLYDHFSAKLESLVSGFGLRRMISEVAQLRKRTRDWYELCVSREEPLTTPQSKTKYYYNPRIIVFEPRSDISNSTCKALTIDELSYTDYLRQKQIFFYTAEPTSDQRNDSQYS